MTWRGSCTLWKERYVNHGFVSSALLPDSRARCCALNIFWEDQTNRSLNIVMVVLTIIVIIIILIITLNNFWQDKRVTVIISPQFSWSPPWISFEHVGRTSLRSTCPGPLALWADLCWCMCLCLVGDKVPRRIFSYLTSQNIFLCYLAE